MNNLLDGAVGTIEFLLVEFQQSESGDPSLVQGGDG